MKPSDMLELARIESAAYEQIHEHLAEVKGECSELTAALYARDIARAKAHAARSMSDMVQATLEYLKADLAVRNLEGRPATDSLGMRVDDTGYEDIGYEAAPPPHWSDSYVAECEHFDNIERRRSVK